MARSRQGWISICAIFLLIFVTRVFAEGEVKNLREYAYRSDGTPWKCTVYDATTGKLKGKIYYEAGGILEKVERFNLDGNRTEAALYSADGGLKEGPDGWAAMRWWYQDSVLRLQISYDERGRPIERLFYSESGKLIMRLYRDDDSINPNVNAAMFMLLGSHNVPYYDPKESYKETSRLVKD